MKTLTEERRVSNREIGGIGYSRMSVEMRLKTG